MIKGVLIFSAGVGAGFTVGYLKAGSDLDREGVEELVVIGKDFFTDASSGIRQLVEERKKQTAYFAQAATATEAVAKKRAEQEVRKTEVDEPEEETSP